jgi:hypothetical protein
MYKLGFPVYQLASRAVRCHMTHAHTSRRFSPPLLYASYRLCRLAVDSAVNSNFQLVNRIVDDQISLDAQFRETLLEASNRMALIRYTGWPGFFV